MIKVGKHATIICQRLLHNIEEISDTIKLLCWDHKKNHFIEKQLRVLRKWPGPNKLCTQCTRSTAIYFYVHQKYLNKCKHFYKPFSPLINALVVNKASFFYFYFHSNFLSLHFLLTRFLLIWLVTVKLTNHTITHLAKRNFLQDLVQKTNNTPG